MSATIFHEVLLHPQRLKQIMDRIWMMKSNDPFKTALRRGISFHHAWMNSKMRSVVEMLFREKYLQVKQLPIRGRNNRSLLSLTKRSWLLWSGLICKLNVQPQDSNPDCILSSVYLKGIVRALAKILFDLVGLQHLTTFSQQMLSECSAIIA